ncbi:MAG: hypothetical protein K8T10_14665 [Candidatus Eremiobacteraeota bacterium]|nr:hypothetical protein [Candidatus Eremiobacteraeota bacterium]
MMVDIAVIPVDSVIDEAVRLNRELSHLASDDIELGEDKVPHVSLLIVDIDKESKVIKC